MEPQGGVKHRKDEITREKQVNQTLVIMHLITLVHVITLDKILMVMKNQHLMLC